MRFALALIVSANVAAAQSGAPFLEGALEPTQDLGCIGIEGLVPTQTAADLALAAENCLAAGAYDDAVESFIAMQVYGVFDAQRVLDMSAHQAVAVMGQNVAQSMTEVQQGAFQEAVGRFGGAGAERHAEACARFREVGPPEYFPRYMVQHGQEAFLYPDDDPLNPDFDAVSAWNAVLVNFLQCEG